MKYVCPNPDIWFKIWLKLFHEARKSNINDFPLPSPPIEGGWDLFSDGEKELMWSDTLEWAAHNNLTYLIPELTEEEYYKVG